MLLSQSAYLGHVLPTSEYLRLRDQIQHTFDFAYIVCQSVPCLKLQVSLVKKGFIKSLPAPDYFNNANNLHDIGEQVKEYKGELCRHTILSSFSYFEAYVVDVVKALIIFHGGEKKFYTVAVGRVHGKIADQGKKFIGLKRPLQKNLSKDAGKIRNSTKALEDENYIFPSALFYPLGIKYLSQKIGNLKASEIPGFLQDAFAMQLPEKLVEQFHEIRDIRNKIAHGQKVSLTLKDVAQLNAVLRDFSLRIDRHLMNSFFITEDYR